MKTWIKVLICFLKTLQKFPYEDVIQKLTRKLLDTDTPLESANIPRIHIVFRSEGIFINGVQIISKKAIMACKTFEILFDPFISDKKSGADPEDHGFVSARQLSKISETDRL
jgi:hypothetical protein